MPFVTLGYTFQRWPDVNDRSATLMEYVGAYAVHVRKALGETPKIVVSMSHKDCGMPEVCGLSCLFVLHDYLVHKV